MTRRELLWTVTILSASLLGFEVSLLRLLLVASWHHFAFLVISVALLGYGASGTLLTLTRRWVEPHASGVLLALVAATALSMPVCSSVAQLVPVEARFVPVLLWRQIGSWVLYWCLLAIPFLLGASAIGLSLIVARQRVGAVYGANLAGSGAGALLAPLSMLALAPQWLPTAWGALALLAGGGSLRRAAPRPAFAASTLAASALAIAALVWAVPPRVRIDPYKYGAEVRRLESQKLVDRIGVKHGPRALLEVYRGDVFHTIPFLSVTASVPPAVHALLADGHGAGSVLDIESADEAEAADHTLMSFAYETTPERPEVLLLGERSGLNVWLASRRRASRIHVVQPDAGLFALLRGPLAESGGQVLDLPGVATAQHDPRHHVEQTANRFDLIQVVTLEALAAGSGGVAGLGQDYLVTVEGMAACLRRLTPRGVLSVCRGIQTPPRDNLKLLATIATAMERIGIERPGEHIVVVRDFLAVCTLARSTAWSQEEIERVRAAIAKRGLTPVWFRGVRPSELNEPDVLESPPEGKGDWFHYGAERIFSPQRERFYKEWLFNVRPAWDDRPFFHDFFKLDSIAPLKRTFGELWLTRAETAFLFALGGLAAAGGLGAVLTVVPLLFLRAARAARGKAATCAYFTAIGLAYILIEMLVLSRLMLLIGDPVSAAAVTLAAFLILSGVGSALAQRICRERPSRLRAAILLLIAMAALTVLLLDTLVGSGGAMPFLARCALAVAITAPTAFLMGFPMPMALARLDRAAPSLIPWAWGVNGFASVMAAPLATTMAMTWGFRSTGVTAIGLYALAAWAFAHLPQPARH